MEEIYISSFIYTIKTGTILKLNLFESEKKVQFWLKINKQKGKLSLK